jgi:hypothetical protein
MSVSDLVRKFKRAATDGERTPSGRKAFDWEPEQAMPVPRSAAVKAVEPAPAAAPAATGPKTSAPQWQQRPAGEPSSVVGGSIPADVADFAVVYRGAAVQAPGHGYGVDRVAGMLAHESLSGLDKSVKASAVLAALDAAGVSIEDVVHDGLVRYKALVAFEAAKELELQQVRPRNERRVEELKAAVAAFEKEKQAEIDALTRESAAAVQTLSRLQARQRAEEDRFHRTLTMFVEPLPARVIPIAPRADAPAPPAEPRPGPTPVPPPAAATPAAPAPAASTTAPAAPAAESDASAKASESAAAPAEPPKDEAQS